MIEGELKVEEQEKTEKVDEQEKIEKVKLVVGQYVQLDIEEDGESYFRQAYVKNVFDDFVLLKQDNGVLFKYEFNIIDKTYKLCIPKKDGNIVMAKKVFGRYTTKPDMR